MTTLDDVFSLYEPHYLNTNPIIKNDEKIIYPTNIGDSDSVCNIKYKCYIKPGEECPICMEQILTMSNAYLSYCGHTYHKKCIYTYMKTKWESKNYYTSCKCPMCRSSLGHPDLKQRYKYSYFDISYKCENGLDKLEDFWLSCEYKLPEYCGNNMDHYLGMKQNCKCCKLYREKGYYY
jgi:hypothetical protein